MILLYYLRVLIINVILGSAALFIVFRLCMDFFFVILRLWVWKRIYEGYSESKLQWAVNKTRNEGEENFIMYKKYVYT